MKNHTFIFLTLLVLWTKEEIFGFEKTPTDNIHHSTKKCDLRQIVYLNYTYIADCRNTGFTALSTLPKNTTRLTFVFNNIPILQEPCFSNFTLLTHLNLESNNIEMVKSQAFVNLTNLNDITLSKNLISYLDIDVFEHTPFLKYLDLSFNRIDRLVTVSNAISRLSLIEKVNLQHNVAMFRVDYCDLRPLGNSSLSYLDLGSCQLINIAPGAFSHLSNLTHLVLSSNPLTYNQSMNVKEILAIPSLLFLDLSNCNINRMEAGTFTDLINLQELHLQNNKLHGVEKNLFTISTLRKLNLSNNTHDLTSYDPFYLGKNNFLNATSLKILHLNDLNILVLERGALYGLVNLDKLFIERSLIEIESFAFESLTALKDLDLRENYLTFLRKDTFYGLSNLTVLSLYKNKLTLLSDDLHFNHLHNLKVLELNKNEIENIPRHFLTVLPHLEYLSLSNNKIVPWHEQIITDVNKHLRLMALQYNNLNFITSAMLTDFNLLHIVDLFLNPFNCSDCRIFDFAYWLNTTNTFTFDPKLIRCEYPNGIAGSMVITVQQPNHCNFENYIESCAYRVNFFMLFPINLFITIFYVL